MSMVEYKFNKPTVDAILNDIRDGVPYVIAAEKNGIHESTFRDWRTKGRKAIADGIDNAYAALVRSLREIEANRIKENLSDIRVSEKGHRGKEWELERSFWRYFSAKAGEIELNERVEALEGKKKNESASGRSEKEEAGVVEEITPVEEK